MLLILIVGLIFCSLGAKIPSAKEKPVCFVDSYFCSLLFRACDVFMDMLIVLV